MIYLEEIKILENHNNLVKDSIITIDKEITLFVGDQGSGKSTLLKLLNDQSSKLELKLSNYTIKTGINTYFFDSEQQNPRVRDLNNFSNSDGSSKGIGYGKALQSRFMSHGEVLQDYTVNGISKAKNCIMFFDEPESALSLRNQYKLIESINIAVKNKCQLFIATHCLPLIEYIENVYSLEHNEWMTSKEFIKTQKL